MQIYYDLRFSRPGVVVHFWGVRVGRVGPMRLNISGNVGSKRRGKHLKSNGCNTKQADITHLKVCESVYFYNFFSKFTYFFYQNIIREKNK